MRDFNQKEYNAKWRAENNLLFWWQNFSKVLFFEIHENAVFKQFIQY